MDRNFQKNLRRLHLRSIKLSGTAIAAQLYAMSRYIQQDLPASRPFDFGQAGHDYFADEQHYGSVADRVFGELRQGGRIALVTGDPPINPLSLAMALTEATSGKRSVLAIACGGNFSEERLCRPAGPSPIFLFDQADMLSDGQLSELCSYLASGGNRLTGNRLTGVLLGRAGFGTRLEKLRPRRPADAGNGRAALRMGETFDPAFLGRIGAYGLYCRARDLGDTEAAQLLERRDPQSPR